jgi:hypothetical protein
LGWVGDFCVVNELESDKHVNMILIEFIEAIGRLADKVRVHIPFEEMQMMLEEMYDDHPEYRDNPPLHYKIEALIVLMIKVSCTKDFKETLFAKMDKYHKEQYNAPKRLKYAHIGGPY